MEKMLPLILVIVVIVNQPIHIAGSSCEYLVGSRDYKAGNVADDLVPIKYTEQLSNSVAISYLTGFLICAGGVTLIVYGIALVAQLLKMNIDAFKMFIIYFIGALLQLAVGVAIALDISPRFGPDSKNASPDMKIDEIATAYRLSVADIVITFVLSVPASIILTVLSAKNLKGAEVKVEQQSTVMKN